MPCNTVRATAVEIGKVDATLLDAALKALGVSYLDYSFRDGELTLMRNAAQLDLARIKVAYSQQVVQTTAKRFGWTLKTKTATSWAVAKRG